MEGKVYSEQHQGGLQGSGVLRGPGGGRYVARRKPISMEINHAGTFPLMFRMEPRRAWRLILSLSFIWLKSYLGSSLGMSLGPGSEAPTGHLQNITISIKSLYTSKCTTFKLIF